MNGNFYYSHKQPIEYDLDGFSPPTSNPYYEEGIKILLDPPDFLDGLTQTRNSQAEMIQNFSRRMFLQITNDQKRMIKSANFTNNDANLSIIQLDHKRPQIKSARTWPFTGTDESPIATVVFDSGIIVKDSWRYTGRSPNFETDHYKTAPSSAGSNYHSSLDTKTSIHLDEFSDNFSLEWWTRKGYAWDESKITVYSTTNYNTPIAEVWWTYYSNGRQLGFQSTFYENLVNLYIWQKFRLEFDVAAKTVSLYIDDAFQMTSAMMNGGGVDGIARTLSVEFDKDATSTRHDDITYPGNAEEDEVVTMSGNIINMAEAASLNLKRFWDMSGLEFKITQPLINADNTIFVEHANHSLNFQGFERIFVLTSTGLLIGREILTISEEDATTERITLKTILNDSVPVADIQRAGYARLCRFEDEEMEFEFYTDSQYTVAVGISELSEDEYGDFT